MSKNLSPKILFEDAHVAVLSKPAGLLSQGAGKNDLSLVDWLREHFGRNYVGLVHRLDRNVSGVMVVAKRSKAAARLTQALQEGKIHGRYRGWILGRLKGERRWRHRLHKNEGKNEVTVIPPGTKKGKEAVLLVRPLASGRWYGKVLTLAEFRLETGRSHQIRVQSAFEGHPLLGDVKYGKSLPNEPNHFPRPALHAYEIVFPHPMSGVELCFKEDLPKDMAGLKEAK